MTNASDESAKNNDQENRDGILPKEFDRWRNLENGLKNDLVFAYRKAKSDVFQTDHLSRLEVAAYEENLWAELCELAEEISVVSSMPWNDLFEEKSGDDGSQATIKYKELAGRSAAWCSKIVGDPHYIFKKADWREDKKDPRIHHFSSQHLRADKALGIARLGAKASQAGKNDAKERRLVLRRCASALCIYMFFLHCGSREWGRSLMRS